jgi:hypothetical protein
MSHTTNSGSGTILTLSYMAEGGRVLTSQVKVYNGKTTLVIWQQLSWKKEMWQTLLLLMFNQ